MSPHRLIFPPSGHPADANARVRHPAERGAWIWHPDYPAGRTAVLRFTLGFHLDVSTRTEIHVTGDQRFQLRCDGCDVSFGPDRCDPDHWTVQTLALNLEAGDHVFESLVWWLADDAGGGLRADPNQGGTPSGPLPPMAQMTVRGGFLLYTDDLPAGVLNTGTAEWQVADLTGAVRQARPAIPAYHDVGPSFDFDLEKWRNAKCVPAQIVVPPLAGNPHGVRRPGWCLYPANLPEQERAFWSGGRIRAVRAGWGDGPFTAEECAEKAGLLPGSGGTISPQTESTFLWDFERYLCGYPSLQVRAGAESVVEWDWAESLYEEKSPDAVHGSSPKGQRDQVAGKVFLGFGDRWRIHGDADTPSLWWRSGRYVRLRIRTGDAPLHIESLGVITTGYPLESGGSWSSSDAGWDRVIGICENSYRAAAHESWTDSPYYEQMSYLGDDRLHALGNYAWYPDDRLSRRAIELFDWSRQGSGLVAERYPSAWRQESVTYSMLWPLMLRDFVFWRDDPDFVRARLPGLRALLAELEGLKQRDGLIAEAPGWPFVDWVPGWDEGCGPGVREGDSSILNLHWVLCLQAAAAVEEAHGDPLLARRCHGLARTAFDAVLKRYWSGDRGFLLDTIGNDAASEHAQFFALLTGLLDAEKIRACLEAIAGGGLAPATIYASFYLLDALYLHGLDADFHRRLAFWHSLPALGICCTPEGPEPARSDSHAWGAHPAWHTLASIAGVRPSAPGFAKVRVAPCPGPMEHLNGSVVHPRGLIKVDLRFSSGWPEGSISLPDGISGEFVWQGVSRPLLPGINSVPGSLP